MDGLFFYSKVIEVKRLDVSQFKRGVYVLEANLVFVLAEVPGGQQLFLILLLGEEDLAGVGILDIRVDLVRLTRISEVEQRVAGDAAHLLLDEIKDEISKCAAKEGSWEGGDHLHIGPLDHADGFHV